MTEAERASSSSDKCFICGKTDTEAPIFPIKYKGENKWVCAKCIPRLIHG